MIFLNLFWTFFRIGLFTFGGGYAMLPLIQEAVLANNWVASEELINFVAVSESTPGPFAVNIATYIGSHQAGIAGAACAALGVVLPSFIVVLIVARIYDAFRKSKAVRGCMSGLKPATIGLIGSAVVSIGKTVFAANGIVIDAAFWVSLCIFGVSLVLALKKVHPILIICIAAAAGIVTGLWIL